MPLMNSQGNANVFKQATQPNNWSNGDVWIDTDDGIAYTNLNGTALVMGAITIDGQSIPNIMVIAK